MISLKGKAKASDGYNDAPACTNAIRGHVKMEFEAQYIHTRTLSSYQLFILGKIDSFLTCLTRNRVYCAVLSGIHQL
jgi:hypothetical protein